MKTLNSVLVIAVALSFTQSSFANDTTVAAGQKAAGQKGVIQAGQAGKAEQKPVVIVKPKVEEVKTQPVVKAEAPKVVQKSEQKPVTGGGDTILPGQKAKTVVEVKAPQQTKATQTKTAQVKAPQIKAPQIKAPQIKSAPVAKPAQIKAGQMKSGQARAGQKAF